MAIYGNIFSYLTHKETEYFHEVFKNIQTDHNDAINQKVLCVNMEMSNTLKSLIFFLYK